MKIITKSSGLTLTEVSLAMLVLGLITMASFLVYRFHVEPSQHVSNATYNLIEAITKIESSKDYNNGAYFAVSEADITDLSQNLGNSPNFKVRFIWAILTDANLQKAEKYKNWDYLCDANTVTIRASFQNISSSGLLYNIAKKIKDSFPSWDCSTIDTTTKTIVCRKTNVTCN